MNKKCRHHLLLSLFVVLAAINLQGQFIIDFETPETSNLILGNQAAIVANPDTVGNKSDSCAFYVKEIGNWFFFGIPLPDTLNTGMYDRLSFKVRTSTLGRLYVKLWKNDEVPLESWAIEYNYMPEPDTWTEVIYDISSIPKQDITLLQIAASVDNEEMADIYYDDISFYNSDSPNGEPIIDLVYNKNKLLLGDTLILDASGSMGVNGDLVNFDWDLGDGTVIQDTSIVHYIYQSPGLYIINLKIINEVGGQSSEKLRIWVYTEDQQTSAFMNINKQNLTNEKIEFNFLTRNNYINPFNDREVKIDALIKFPNEDSMVIPSFYFIDAGYENMKWTFDESINYWKVRIATEQVGLHQIQLIITDTTGVYHSKKDTFLVEQGMAPGIIRQDDSNAQFYRHSTGEPFYPMGINAAWDNINNYGILFENLSVGQANMIRYWHAGFNRQSLEWDFYGLGKYDPIAAAKQDTMFELCRTHDLNLQMCIFHHGMYSHTVNSNWDQNPYNIANGGFLANGEDFFQSDEAIQRTKSLLRYIIGRWGYSRNLFAWELFNEVQWTGNHPNQTAQWDTSVIEWHKIMTEFIKQTDPYNHMVTTSANDDQLLQLNKNTELDILQYHTYPGERILAELAFKDAHFLDTIKNAAIICGEYGYGNNQDIQLQEQLLAIWTSLFSHVPHFIWRWQLHYNSDWSNLFNNPSMFLDGEDFASEGTLESWKIKTNSTAIVNEGFKSGLENYYGIIYKSRNKDSITIESIPSLDIPFGKYDFEFYDLETQNVESVEINAFPRMSIDLPPMKLGVAIKGTFVNVHDTLLAFVGEDQVIGLGHSQILDASESIISLEVNIIYTWTMLTSPDSSLLEFEPISVSSTEVIPDVPGDYQFLLSLIEGAFTSTDTLALYVSDNPIAIAGDPIFVELGIRPAINGRQSFDPEGDRITYSWRIISKPEISQTELKLANSSRPALDADVLGDYLLELIVNDGYSNSIPDTLLVQVGAITQVVYSENLNNEPIIFPIPVTSKVSVHFENDEQVDFDQGQIIDFQGNTMDIVVNKIGRNKWDVDIGILPLSTGSYLLRLTGPKSVIISKISVIR